MNTMARKSFTIDHILNGEDNKTANNYNNNIHPFLSEQQHGQFQQHDPATLAYWMGQAYYPTGSWPIPTAATAIWLQQQQQQQPRHSSNMPVDLSASAQRLHHQQTIGQQQHSSLFNSNWGPAAAAAMTGCWTTNGPSPELLAYSHHGLSPAVGSPFFLSQHPDPAIRIAVARRHLPVLPQQPPSRKGGQIRFTHRQSHHLEETFNTTRYLTPGQRRALANRLTLTERQVKTWFQNRRAKWRRTRKGDKISNGDPNQRGNKNELVNFDEDEEDDIEEDDIESSSDEETTKVELQKILS